MASSSEITYPHLFNVVGATHAKNRIDYQMRVCWKYRLIIIF